MITTNRFNANTRFAGGFQNGCAIRNLGAAPRRLKDNCVFHKITNPTY
jgi:hypothetical protein